MKASFILIFLFTVSFLATSLKAGGQADSAGAVEILPPTGKLEVRNGLQIFYGGVRLRQGTTYFTADSVVLNQHTSSFQAYGNVHINDSDTAKLWSNTLRYQWDTKLAYLNGRVRLTDGKISLNTASLDYDVSRKIGTYRNGGQVLSGKTKLNSNDGIYYLDTRDFYFSKKVVLKDPGYELKTDSLLYNTELQIARFMAATTIKDSSGRVIQTREGIYDVKGGKAEFTSRTTVQDKARFLAGDRIATDDATGMIQVEGRGVLIDTAAKLDLLANQIFINRKTDALLATRQPVMTVRQDRDSFFIAADTLFTARLSSLFTDSLTQKRKGDSTDRYIEAYRNVRVFSDSIQSASDSLFYSLRDSIFQLYQNPVVWSKKNQITGDTILLYTKNQKADRFRVFDNSFLASEVQPGVYNQIQSSRMEGFLTNGQIDSVAARGLAESVYFIQDQDSAFSSVNQTSSDVIDIYFDSGELYKVVLRSAVKGDLYPIAQKQPATMRLKNFAWLDERRPRSKYDLFQ